MNQEGITNRPSPPDPPRQPPQEWTGYEIAQVISSAAVLAAVGLFVSYQFSDRDGSGFPLLVGFALGGTIGALLALQNVYALRPRGVRVDARGLPSGAPPSRHKPALPTTDFMPGRASYSFAPAPGLLRPHRLQGHGRAVRGLVVSPLDAVAISCGDDGMVQAWDLATGFALWGMKAFASEGCSIAYSHDGSLLAAAGIESSPSIGAALSAVVHILDARTGMPLRRLEIRDDPLSLAFLPGGRRLLVGTRGAVRLWELGEPSLVESISLYGELGVFATEEAASLATDARGRSILVGTRWTEEARVLTLPGGEVARRLRGKGGRVTWFRQRTVRAVAFSPDNTLALSGSNDGTVRVWDIASGTQTCRFDGHAGWCGWHGVTGVAWLPDGQTALSCGEDGTMRRWETGDGIESACLVHGKSIRCMAVSADGRTALTGASDGSIRVWHF